MSELTQCEKNGHYCPNCDRSFPDIESKKEIWFNSFRPIINAIGDISVQEAMDFIEKGL